MMQQVVHPLLQVLVLVETPVAMISSEMLLGIPDLPTL
jgi:hypothetical protein